MSNIILNDMLSWVKVKEVDGDKLFIDNLDYCFRAYFCINTEPELKGKVCERCFLNSLLLQVSTLKCGLLPLSQEACLIGDISYHSYNGIVIDPEERQSLAKDLGPNNKVMFLRNHGVVCCGRSIEEAWLNSYHTVLAADTQIKMMPMGLDNLVLIDEETRRKVYEVGQKGGGGVNTAKKEWGVGELEFEALMRMLDNSGYRTGHTYVDPLVRKEPAKMISDVELPPTASNLGYLMDEEELYKDGPLRVSQENSHFPECQLL